MGKKADLLLKQLVEKDEEIVRLRRKLNGGVECRMRVLVFRDEKATYRSDLTIRTAGDGFGIKAEDGEEIIINPFDVLELKFGDVPVVWEPVSGSAIDGVVVFLDEGAVDEEEWVVDDEEE